MDFEENGYKNGANFSSCEEEESPDKHLSSHHHHLDLSLHPSKLKNNYLQKSNSSGEKLPWIRNLIGERANRNRLAALAGDLCYERRSMELVHKGLGFCAV